MTSRQGRASWYALAAGPEVLDVLGAAERLLAVTGDAVVLCPRHGADGLGGLAASAQ